MSTAKGTLTQSGGQVIALDDRQRKSEGLIATAIRRIRKDYLTLLAMTYVVILTLLSIGAPLIEQALDVSYTATDPINKFLPLGTEGHILGTDALGRDHFARLLYGGRVSLSIGFTATIFATLVGVSLGLVAGYYQGGRFGFVDDLILWFITTLNSIPSLMLLILIASVLTPSIPTLILVLTFISWSGTMRLIRGETLSHRESEYVVSARAMGAGPVRIMFVHILPNTLSVLVTAMAIEVGTLILVETALSFLGLGVQPPDPSWGNMLTGAQSAFRQAAHLAIFPGLLISTTVLSLYLIGDGLRDALDPRSTR